MLLEIVLFPGDSRYSGPGCRGSLPCVSALQPISLVAGAEG